MNKHTLKEKILILRDILKQYSRYMDYFDKSRCYTKKGDYFYIMFIRNRETKFGNGTSKKKLKKKDIDKIIKRYRSKLNYEMNKHIKDCMKNRVCQKRFKKPYHLYRINII